MSPPTAAAACVSALFGCVAKPTAAAAAAAAAGGEHVAWRVAIIPGISISAARVKKRLHAALRAACACSARSAAEGPAGT